MAKANVKFRITLEAIIEGQEDVTLHSWEGTYWSYSQSCITLCDKFLDQMEGAIDYLEPDDPPQTLGDA